MIKDEDSLEKRYGAKITTYIIGVPITILIQAIIPRGLGVEAYGQFNFLTNFYQKVIGFLDSGTSIAFYTKLSKDLKDKSIIRFYGGVVFGACSIIYILTEVTLQFSNYSILFPEQLPIYIRMATIFSFFYWISQITNKIVDAYGLTVKGEIIRLVQQVLSLVLILCIYYFNYLNLEVIFIYNYLTFSLLIVGWTAYLNKEDVKLFKLPKLNAKEIKNKAIEFWDYSSPLISYSLISMFLGIFDYWFLQNIAGSVEQGYFGLAFKVAAICIVFTKAMTPLITREYSVAQSNFDYERMRYLFKRYCPLLYAISAILAIFIVVNARDFTMLFGGSEFEDAVLAMAIMALYPIHQTYGQLNGAIFYATDNTRLYRNIGVSTMILGVFALYFLVGPAEYGGFELGANGLALKLVIIQFIAVNIQLWYNTKLLKVSFWKYFLKQITTVVLLLAFALLSKYLLKEFFEYFLIGLFLNGVLYLILVGLLLLLFPKFIGFTKKELQIVYIQIKGFIRL